MNTSNPILLFAGLIAGFLVWSRIAAWVMGTRGGKNLANGSGAAEPSSKELVRLLILIASIWIALFSAVSIYALRSGALTPNWLWFLGGTALAPCMVFVNILVTLRRVKKRKADQNAL